jgi:hypothetical protein
LILTASRKKFGRSSHCLFVVNTQVKGLRDKIIIDSFTAKNLQASYCPLRIITYMERFCWRGCASVDRNLATKRRLLLQIAVHWCSYSVEWNRRDSLLLRSRLYLYLRNNFTTLDRNGAQLHTDLLAATEI